MFILVDCICGGKNILAAISNENATINPITLEEKEKGSALETFNPDKTEKSPTDDTTVKNNNNSSTMEIEIPNKEENMCGNTNMKIQMELLDKQNNDLIKEKAILKKEIENE